MSLGPPTNRPLQTQPKKQDQQWFVDPDNPKFEINGLGQRRTRNHAPGFVKTKREP